MRWYAEEAGRGDEEHFWAMAGLLHDVDFEKYPEEHCKKAPELLAEIGRGAGAGPRGGLPRLTASAPMWSRRMRWRSSSSPAMS